MKPDEAATPPNFPIKENLQFVDGAVISRYFDRIFSPFPWTDDYWLCLRGVGEKGTSQEGKYRTDVFVQPSVGGFFHRAMDVCERWAQWHVASFVIPAPLQSASGKADQVAAFTNSLCDFDTGNTDDKLAYLRHYVGEPSMVILSGGTTETGHPKRHVYYCYTEPTADIMAAIRTRDSMARKGGGDLTMGLGVESNPRGRCHQPVRIPGTCHGKGGIAKACLIESEGPAINFDRLQALLGAMPVAPWATAPEQPLTAALISAGEIIGNIFSPTSGRDMDATLLLPVHEGGTDRTRFSEFNRVAGHYISQIRRGSMTTNDAREATLGWMLSSMVPPWDDHRGVTEFNALLARDGATDRQLPSRPQTQYDIASNDEKVIDIPVQRTSEVVTAISGGLTAWAAHRWVKGPKPSHEFLVEKLMIRGEAHLFAAEGGSGKTYLGIDLAMKLAAHMPGDQYEWCGQKILNGGAVVLMLNEDSMTEMHIRMVEIDKDDLIRKAGDRLIVLPMQSLGGAFAITQRGMGGETKSSHRWEIFMQELKKITDLKAVIIDTFSSASHGDENSSTVVNEMMREANRIPGETKAALMFMHHLKKDKESPHSLSDLTNYIRGSSAIPAAFRVNMGMFRAVDYQRRMQAMGLIPEKDALWRFGIAKCNINGLMKGEKSLLRAKTGLLEDVTGRDKFNAFNLHERMAWLVLAVKIAAEVGHPYAKGAKNAKSGLYSRRAELPPVLRKTSQFEFDMMLEAAMHEDKLTQCAIKGSRSKAFYDVPEGPLASNTTGGEEVASGAYNVTADWDEYAFDPIERKVLLRSEIRDPFPGAVNRE